MQFPIPWKQGVKMVQHAAVPFPVPCDGIQYLT